MCLTRKHLTIYILKLQGRGLDMQYNNDTQCIVPVTHMIGYSWTGGEEGGGGI